MFDLIDHGLRFLYEHRLKKYDKPAELLIPPSLESLDENLDVVVNLAERYYYNCDVRETHRISTAVLKKGTYIGLRLTASYGCMFVCLSVCHSVLSLFVFLSYLSYSLIFSCTLDSILADPYHSSCLPLHIAVLVELKKSNDLFYLAHNLVDVYPGKAVAWFAVGCYYMLVNKHETARR